MTTNPGGRDFPSQLKNYYGNKIVIGEKSSKDVIEYCKEHYHLTLVPNLKESDPASYSAIESYKCMLDQTDKRDTYNFEIYQLEKNDVTEKFYKYQHDRFEHLPNVYIYHETQTGKLFSNCSLFEVNLILLKGISEKEVQNDTRQYLHYLNSCYMYDSALKELEK